LSRTVNPPADASRREGLFERIAELLDVTYRSEDLGNLEDPLSETVYILLSRQTREGVYRQVFASLRERYPRWIDVLAAPCSELRDLLRPGGFHEQRAGQLLALLAAVRDADQDRRIGPFGTPPGDLTLDFLAGLGDDDAETFLRGLPGIGPKSARCVLAYSLARNAFAVDTHVRRIFLRLGLLQSKGIKADHDPFQDAVPAKLRKQLHINLVHHGRAVCQQRDPRCHQCVLVSFCAEGRQRAAAAADPAVPVAIDLFAGAGGISEGFRQEGFRVALAVESDRHAAQSYRANHPGVPVIEEDVASLDAKAIRAAATSAARVDVVLAGPPCQGYSAAGKRVPDDHKNFLFRQVGRLAATLNAEFVVMENVPGLRRVNGQQFLRRILHSLRGHGFSAGWHLLNAQDFGLPQIRRRYIFIARRRGAGPLPDRPGREVDGYEPGLLRKRLEDLPPLAAGVKAEYYRLPDGGRLLNGSTMSHSPRVIRKIAKIKPGEGPISYRRLESDAARTLIAGHRALPVHPWLDRTISVREAARIQGFRDGYVFCGLPSVQPLQVANAVPPAVAAAVARVIRQAWQAGTGPEGAQPRDTAPTARPRRAARPRAAR
jgi:DNA (cytosine-5)-methyltransferase 1